MSIAAALTIGLSSCNYLDFDQSNGYNSADEVYETWGRAQQSLTNLYGYMKDGFMPVGNSMRECATDDAQYVWTSSNIHVYNDDRWSPLNTIDDLWGHYYSGIRDVNSFLTNYENANFDRYKYNPDYEAWLSIAQYWTSEARFLRALYHFELAKRYGSIVLAKDAIYTLDDVNTLTRSSFAETVAYIVAECDEIADKLPVDYESVKNKNTGRITKGAVLALKSRALLFAASKTYNADASIKDWEAAASAANDVIEMDHYSLHDGLFPFNSSSDIITSPELILERRLGESSNFEAINTSVSFEGGKTGVCPSQNLVDAFETKNGYRVTLDENGVWKSDDIAFDPSNPYQNRDSRFAATLLYNGSTWHSKTMECYTGGKDGSTIVNASPTGYYLKKYMNENVELSPIVRPTIHTWVIMRYAEILLNYAEAMNEAYGPNDKQGFELTALQALNAVRSRAGQPDKVNVTDPAVMRELIRNERRVEFAFEDQRFWDIRRWNIGDNDDVKNIKGVVISEDQKSYTLKSVQNRTWSSKKNLYPISVQETYNNPNLGQNPGW